LQKADAFLQDLCCRYNIQTGIKAAESPWGLSLVAEPGQPAQYMQQQQEVEQVLVSVPLPLVLSCTIPGCSPCHEDTPPELQHLLHQR
jgi:hypothetical protein